MSNQATATPRIEALFGPTAVGLHEAVLLQRMGRQTFKVLLETLYPLDAPSDDNERLYCEETLGEALDTLSQEGFITSHPVGDKNHLYQWEFELTPAGSAEAQKVTIMQEGDMLWLRAMGTDGQMHAHSEQILADDE